MKQELKRAQQRKEKTASVQTTQKKNSRGNKKLKEKTVALLEKINAILKEHKKEACPKSHTPHVHLCDGTKMDLRKMFR